MDSRIPLGEIRQSKSDYHAVYHIVISLLAFIKWWLDNKMNLTPAEPGKVYKNLIIDSPLER